MRRFAGIDLGRERVPDETTACKFRHLLEENRFGESLFAQALAYLQRGGIKLSRGTIVGHPHFSPVLDQEPGVRARAPDAPDPEGQPEAFRHER